MNTRAVVSCVLGPVIASTVLWTASVEAALVPVVQARGKISISADAEGNNDFSGGWVRIDKPAGATVRGAYFMAAGNYSRWIANGDVSLAGTPVSWDRVETNASGEYATFFNNVYADVTDLVKPILDGGPAGVWQFLVTEVNTTSIDGSALVVLFDDPGQATERTAILLFGAQETDGENFFINLAEPLDVDSPAAQADMGLGISFGYQGNFGTDMVSWIDVNGFALTSSAGGEDDGFGYDGALITIGGIDDTNANPPPFAPSSGYRTDDELYNLLPYVEDGDTSILVSTVNPTDDDNIFFAYFIANGAAGILPVVVPPAERTLLGNINPSLPTIVLTHGLQKRGSSCSSNSDCDDPETCRFGMCTSLWSGSGQKQASTLIQDALGDEADDVNIVQYIWEEAYTVNGFPGGDEYKKAQLNVVDAGVRLAGELRAALGPDYDKPVHFIGHSLGTAVNARAAATFLAAAPGVSKAQFTALDRPHHIRDRIPLCNPNCGIPDITELDEKIFGYDVDFFASVLPVSRPGLDLRIDNYYSLDGAGVGDVASGATTYNYTELINPNDLDDLMFDDEGIDNNHSGVEQWYRWTMAPNDIYDSYTVCNSTDGELLNLPLFLDSSLNPCLHGWHWGINNLAPAMPWEDRFPQANGAASKVSAITPVALDNQQDFGCEFIADGPVTTVVCTEASSPFAVAEVEIPDTAAFLTFEYKFGNIGDGDYAAVLVDETPVWVLAGASVLEAGTFQDSGLIPIRDRSGTHSLTIALYGVGAANAEFEVRKFGVVSAGPTCGNASVDDDEQCDDGDAAYFPGEACRASCLYVPCGQPATPDGAGPKATDALFTLRVAVGSADCAARVCDVNSSGAVTTVDALNVLKRAVGIDVSFVCPG